MNQFLRRCRDSFLCRIKWEQKWKPLIYRHRQSCLIKEIRKKDEIRVLFVLAELGAWKTESLYVAMLKHPRFNPIIGVTTSLEVPGSKEQLVSYLKSKKYSFVDLDATNDSISSVSPDIKFYYKPYPNSYPSGIFFDYHMDSVVCHIFYGFSQGGTAHSFNHKIWRYSWKAFVENDIVINTAKSLGVSTGNFVVTGTPMEDLLSQGKESFSNPWKLCGEKVKIIYAPHHSLKGTNKNFIEYSTFLELGETILHLAKKYSEKVQWAFKPHPTLYPKLLKVWGKEKTDAYYDEWKNMDNSQLELGEYVGLFKYSDAMIHDSCSFIVEYMFTGKPVMFLERQPQTAEQLMLGEFGYRAYQNHYHGKDEEQIEAFINDIILGNDPKKKERKKYYQDYLIPPYGMSASDNIIDAILGEGHYKYLR